MSGRFNGQDAFQTEKNASAINSNGANQENVEPGFVSTKLVMTQKILTILIAIFVLIFTYLLYGRYLSQSNDGYTGKKKTKFIGDLYKDPQNYQPSSRKGKNRDGLSTSSYVDGEFINFGDDSNVSEFGSGTGTGAGRNGGAAGRGERARERERQAENKPVSGKGKGAGKGSGSWFGSWFGSGPNSGSKSRSGSAAPNRGRNRYGANRPRPRRRWYSWFPEIYRYPIKKTKDAGNWVISLFRGKPTKGRGRGRPTGKGGRGDPYNRDPKNGKDKAYPGRRNPYDQDDSYPNSDYPERKDPYDRDPKGGDRYGIDPNTRDPSRRDPNRRDPYGSEPNESEPYGNDPYGRDSNANDPYGRDSNANDPYGRDPNRRNPYDNSSDPNSGYDNYPEYGKDSPNRRNPDGTRGNDPYGDKPRRTRGPSGNDSPMGDTERAMDGRSENSEYPIGGRDGKKNKDESGASEPNMGERGKLGDQGTDLYGDDGMENEESPTRGRPEYDEWKSKPSPKANIPEYGNKKYSVPKDRVNMPNMEDIRKNPDKYKQDGGDFLEMDPEQSKADEEQERKDLEDLFGDDSGDDLGEEDDEGFGRMEGLGLLLDPSFLGNIQGLIQDLNGSNKNFNRNKEMLKKFKKEIDSYKNKRNKCRDQYRKDKKELEDKEENKRNLKKALADMENEKLGLENSIKSEEDAYMKGNQRNLKNQRNQLENQIHDLEEIIQNEKPLLAELDNKKRQENDILSRIREVKERIKAEENLKQSTEEKIKQEKSSISLNQKDLTISKFKIRGFTKSMAVKKENLKLRDLVDDMKDKSQNITNELDKIYQDKQISEEELKMIMDEMRELGDMDLDLNYKNDHEKFAALKDTLEELKKKALTMDFKGIEMEIQKLNRKIKDNQKISRNCKSNINRSNMNIEDFTKMIGKCENTLKNLYEELKKLESQLLKCRQYIESKTMELKNAKEMREDKLRAKKEISKQLQDLQNKHVKQNNDLRGQKANKLREINDVRDKLQKNKASLYRQNKRLNRLYNDCIVFDKYAQDAKRRALKIKKKFPLYKKAIKKIKKEIRMKLKSLSGITV